MNTYNITEAIAWIRRVAEEIKQAREQAREQAQQAREQARASDKAKAWDLYFGSVISTRGHAAGVSIEQAAKVADEMLRERAKRFDLQQGDK